MPPITVSRVATTLFSISLAAWQVARARARKRVTLRKYLGVTESENNRAVATYVRAFTSDGVDLVDEHQCGSVVGRLLEQVAYL